MGAAEVTGEGRGKEERRERGKEERKRR